MQTDVILILGILLPALIFARVMTSVILPARFRATEANFQKRYSALGFRPVPSPGPLWIACAGEFQGYRALLMLVESRMDGVPLPPRIDIFVEAGFKLHGIEGGGILMRPDTTAILNGRPDAQAAFSATLTPELVDSVQSRLGGRFALSSYDSRLPGSPLRRLVGNGWPTEWTGLVLQTWTAKDAEPAMIRASLEGLIEVGNILANSPGIRSG